MSSRKKGEDNVQETVREQDAQGQNHECAHWSMDQCDVKRSSSSRCMVYEEDDIRVDQENELNPKEYR